MSRGAAPNAVYERTHVGLSSLVPGRAARRILDAALVAGRRSAQAVSAEEMARLLMGPVLRDLSQVLPRDGVRRELRELARSLRGREPDRGGAPEAAATTPAPEPFAAPAPEATLEPIAAPAPDATLEPVTDTSADTLPLPETAAAAGSETAAAAVADAPDVAPPLPAIDLIGAGELATPVPPPRSEEAEAIPDRPAAPDHEAPIAPRRALPDDHELVLAALAPLDGVAGVGTFDANGAPQAVRGELPDPEVLGRVIAAGGRLLGRDAALRTVCVGTTTSVLVAVPVPPRWLAVAGRSDLNLGAVYAALAALEEER